MHRGIHHRRHSIEENVSLIVRPFPTDVMRPIAPIDDALWPAHSTTPQAHGISLSLPSVAVFALPLVDGTVSSSDAAMTPYLQLSLISFENAAPSSSYLQSSERKRTIDSIKSLNFNRGPVILCNKYNEIANVFNLACNKFSNYTNIYVRVRFE